MMYVVIRKFPNMQNVQEAARRAETGLGPVLKQQPGFKGYYIVQLEGGGGASISLFESADAAKAAHQRALSWLKENLAELTGGGEPEVTMGEVLAQVTA
jgi:hypothetical protein